MLKLEQIIRLTPSFILGNAKNCRPTLIRSVVDADKNGAIFRKAIFKSRDSVTKNPPKVITIKLYDDVKDINKSTCWLHCSCEYFLYNLEYALTSKGSSSIINCNGQYPVEKNPALKPHACKHIISVLPLLRNAKFVLPRKKTELEIELDKQKIRKMAPPPKNIPNKF